MDATRRLAEQNGYEKTSMRDIAKESGLSVGAVYHHYSNKEAMMNEAFLYFDDELSGESVKRYEKLDPLSALKAILLDHAAFLEAVGVSLMREYYRALLNGKVQNAVSPQRTYYKTVHALVKKAQASGMLAPEVESSEITEYLVKSLRGTMIDWCLHDGEYGALDKVRSEVDHYFLPYLV